MLERAIANGCVQPYARLSNGEFAFLPGTAQQTRAAVINAGFRIRTLEAQEAREVAERNTALKNANLLHSDYPVKAVPPEVLRQRGISTDAITWETTKEGQF